MQTLFIKQEKAVSCPVQRADTSTSTSPTPQIAELHLEEVRKKVSLKHWDRRGSACKSGLMLSIYFPVLLSPDGEVSVAPDKSPAEQSSRAWRDPTSESAMHTDRARLHLASPAVLPARAGLEKGQGREGTGTKPPARGKVHVAGGWP